MSRRILLLTLLVAGPGIALVAIAAQPPAPPVSSFAPADDLVGQVDFYIQRTEETLAKKSDFDDAAIARLKKDANTLTVLALVLGMHDTQNRVQPAAAELLGASQQLAKSTDYAAAVATFDRVKQAAAGKAGPAAADLKWEKVASLGQLMKQVPMINAALKRGVTAERFETLKPQSAGHAAVLAAIAQAVYADTHEVKNPADMDKWYRYCDEMRDAAGAVNAAIHAGDQATTTKAMSRLAASCEACHATFRKDAN